MKKIFYILLSGLLFSGCAMQNETTGPDMDLQVQKSWLKINTGLRIEEQISVCKTINGESGGVFVFNDKPDDIKVHGKLTIPNGAYSGDLEICVVLDGQTTFLTFSPAFDFNTPVFLDLTYKDVDLTGVDPSDLEFYYIDDDNQLIPAQYESRQIDIEKGLLKITKVQLHHFSRYGWAK